MGPSVHICLQWSDNNKFVAYILKQFVKHLHGRGKCSNAAEATFDNLGRTYKEYFRKFY